MFRYSHLVPVGIRIPTTTGNPPSALLPTSTPERTRDVVSVDGADAWTLDALLSLVLAHDDVQVVDVVNFTPAATKQTMLQATVGIRVDAPAFEERLSQALTPAYVRQHVRTPEQMAKDLARRGM